MHFKLSKLYTLFCILCYNFPKLLSSGTQIRQIPESCLEILNSFSHHASNFTHCSIVHARPVKFCESCVNHYVNFQKSYKNLFDTMINDTSCSSMFLSHDRLDIVLGYHDNILSMWIKGNCNECFDWLEEEPRLSNNTNHFNNMLNSTLQCIHTHLRGNPDEVCSKCMQTYVGLDEFYKTLSKDAIGVDNVCMDIVDSMNATRSIWSKQLDCCKLRKSPEVIFLVCSGIISVLPLLYYITLRYFGPMKEFHNVLKQSRFKQMILKSSNSRRRSD